MTLYVRIGDWLGTFSLLAAALGVIWVRAKRRAA
jgi:hypothetical protein